MSVVITATTGHLGALIVQAVLDRGAAPDTVVATAREPARLTPIAELGVRTARVDYDDPTTVSEVVAEGDVLVLVSGTARGHRVEQHTGIIAAAKRAGVGRILYTSAPAATTSALILAPDHKATEQHLNESGVPTTILRNGWYTENYAQQVQAGRTQGVFFGSAGNGRVASASRKDYAEAAAVAALDSSYGGGVLELSGDTAWTYAELAEAVGHTYRRSVTYDDLAPIDHLDRLRAAGLPEDAAAFVVALDANIRDGLLGRVTGELSATIRRPTTSLEETLAAAAL